MELLLDGSCVVYYLVVSCSIVHTRVGEEMIALIFWNIVVFGVITCSIDVRNNSFLYAVILLSLTVLEVLCWCLGYIRAIDEIKDYDEWH